MSRCVRCNGDASIHAMADGNDVDFCSENCIEKYMAEKPIYRVTILERWFIKERVVFT